jgi:5-methylcytosine-specific restriction endonuclease McrA
MPLLDEEAYQAKLEQKRAMQQRAAEKRRARQKAQALQRVLKKQHKQKLRVRPGRLGATVLEPFTERQLAARMRALGGKCIYCSGPFQHVDHLVPVALGGRHALWNLAPSCRPCNLSKRDSSPLEWADRKAINKTAVLLVDRALKRHARKENASRL